MNGDSYFVIFISLTSTTRSYVLFDGQISVDLSRPPSESPGLGTYSNMLSTGRTSGRRPLFRQAPAYRRLAHLCRMWKLRRQEAHISSIPDWYDLLEFEYDILHGDAAHELKVSHNISFLSKYISSS